MMAKNQKPTRDEQEKADMEKMQKRVESMLPAKADIPASISIQQAEELKARISELEAKLAGQQPDIVQEPSASSEIEPAQSLPVKSSTKAAIKLEETASNEVPRKKIALWVAGIFTAVSLAFFGFSIYTLLVSQGGKVDLSDMALMPVTILMVIANLIGIRLIRRDRYSLGVWIMYLVNVILPPILAVISTGNIYILISGYLIIFSLIFIGLVIPKESQWKAIITSVGTALVIVIVEVWGPAFRVSTNHLETFTPVVIALTVVAVLTFFVLQVWTGGLRNKLLAVLIGVTVVATGAVSAFVIVTTINNLRENLERELSTVAINRATQLGDLFNEQIDNLTALSVGEVLQGRMREQNRSYQGDASAIQTEIDAKDAQWQAADAANNNADFLVRERLSNAAARDLLEYQKIFPDNAEIFITDIYGGLAASTNRTTDYNQADETWWQAAYNYGQGAVYISDPQFDASANTLGIQIALPLHDRVSGKIIGILRTTYIMSPLADILKQGIGENSSADIFIPGETVNQIREGALVPVDSQVLEKLQAVAGQGMAEMDYQGNPSVVSQAVVQSRNGNQAIKNLGWILAFHQNRSEAFAPVNAQVRGIIIVILIVIFLGVLVAIFVAQVLVKPLTQLTNTAQEISAGNLNSQAQVTSSDEIGILAGAFNSMTAQLRGFIGSLEKRVADRTHDLELASEVGRTIAEKVENTSVMLTDATEMIRSNFNLYYTQVYLLDPSGQTITLRAGTGEAGRQLLQRGHHLLVNSSSLNGRAVSEKRPVIVADTQKSGTFLPNPLLPKTRSEMAIPLLVGNKVLGVLDMQSETPDALNEDNLAAFQVLAGQLSVAIQNATLFAQSEEARKQVEANVRQITTSGWQDFLNGNDRGEKIGYVFDQNEVRPMERKSKAISDNILSMPITVTGAAVGSIEVAQDEREWTANEMQIIQSTAEKLSQHIEGLRLLAQAENYRQEAEQNTRRLTREGWEDYIQTRNSLIIGYSFIPNEIKVENEEVVIDPSSALNLPLKVRDETVGELVIQGLGGSNDSESISLANAVVERLGAHIESLRLSSQTEQALAATQEFAKREQSLRQITSAVRGSTNPATILRTAVRELGTLLGRKAVIRLAANTENIETKVTENNGKELASPADKPISAVGGNK